MPVDAGERSGAGHDADAPAAPLYMVQQICRDPDAGALYAPPDAAHPESGTVAVVQQYEVPGAVRFMTLGRAVIGAQYVDEEFQDQAAFTGMAVMQAAAHLNGTRGAAARRSLHIGLGVGSVPGYFHQLGLHADSVERSACVVKLAARYFDHQRCAEAPSALGSQTTAMGMREEEEAQEECPLGHTVVGDAFEVLQLAGSGGVAGAGHRRAGRGRGGGGGRGGAGDAQRRLLLPGSYDVVVADVFMGADLDASYSEAVFRRLREDWLLPADTGGEGSSGGGVLVTNVVSRIPPAGAPGVGDGSSDSGGRADTEPPPLFARSLKATLEAAFGGPGTVRCFRDMPLDLHPDLPSNVACFARARGAGGAVGFDIPARYFWDSPYLSSDYVMAHFQEWELDWPPLPPRSSHRPPRAPSSVASSASPSAPDLEAAVATVPLLGTAAFAAAAAGELQATAAAMRAHAEELIPLTVWPDVAMLMQIGLFRKYVFFGAVGCLLLAMVLGAKLVYKNHRVRVLQQTNASTASKVSKGSRNKHRKQKKPKTR